MILVIKTSICLFLITLLACSNNRKPGDGDSSFEISGSFKDSVLVKGLNYPWELAWGPDNHIWMTERGGRISRVNPSTGKIIRIATIPDVVSNGEGGLLGMVLHPNFTHHPMVFISYDYNDGGDYREKIVRFIYRNDALTEPKIILDKIEASFIHDGCRLLITPDLKLLITTGDASHQDLPQNKSALNGKVLRLNLDGSIPADNPVPGNPYWTFGHRNAQGLVYANNILYSSEHGPDTDDELNIIEKGRNYGWPTVKGFCDNGSERIFCVANNVKEPIKAWTPTAAVCGLDYYDNNRIPEWKNSLLLVALKNARLYQMRLDDSHRKITETKEFFTNKYGRLRDVCVAPDGRVFICTSNGGNGDKIIVIR